MMHWLALAAIVEQGSRQYGRPVTVQKPVVDTTTGLMRVCFAIPAGSSCGFTMVARTAAAGDLGETVPGKVAADASIGLTYAQLLERFKSDPNFAGKNVLRAADGSVTTVQLTDKDPPPRTYDRGYQATTWHYYALEDGVVVGHLWIVSEN